VVPQIETCKQLQGLQYYKKLKNRRCEDERQTHNHWYDVRLQTYPWRHYAIPNLGECLRSLRKLVKSCSWPHHSQKM